MKTFSKTLLVALCLCTYLISGSAGADERVLLAQKNDEQVSQPQPKISPQQRALVTLGEALYFDTRVSSDNTTSCSSCHSPEHGFGDGRDLAVGRIGSPESNGRRGFVGTRRTQPNLNTMLREYLKDERMFWDLRAANSVAQATMPIENPIEMGNQTVGQVAARLNQLQGYRDMTRAAFGADELTPRRMAEALVAYQRTEIVAVDTPLNRYYQGKEDAVSEQGKRGAALFKTHCISCHSPPLFTTGEAFNTGMEDRFSRQLTAEAAARGEIRREDLGLERTTKNPNDRRKFKTPGIIGLTARRPPLNLNHHGQIHSVRDQIVHYAAAGNYRLGGNTQTYRDPSIDPRVAKIKLADNPAALEQAILDLEHTVLVDLMPDDYPTGVRRPERLP